MILNKIIDEDTEQIILENEYWEDLTDKTILVTGASGMIGSYVIYVLMKLNEKFNSNINIIPLIRNLNKLPNQVIHDEHINPLIQDVIEKIEYEGDVDYIIHAASPASPELMKKYPVETNFTNTLGTANMLNFAREHNTKKFLFTSTREIYGQSISNQKYFKEDDLGVINQLLLRNSYAESKKAAENMCLGFKEEYGLDTKIVRLAHTFGPGMNINHNMVHTEFLRNVLDGRDIVLRSDGSSIRTYTYIADSVSAIFKVLLKSKDVVYNISNDENEVSIKELAEIIIKLCPDNGLKLIFDIKDEEKTMGYDSFKFCLLSSHKIKSELDWNPKYSVKNGFKRTFDYLNDNEL